MWKSLVFFFLFTLAAAAESNTVVISSFENGAITWGDTVSNGFYQIEWASEAGGPWARTWVLQRNLHAEGGQMQAPVPMFYRVVLEPDFFEDFETDGGWSDHPAGDWTEEAQTGTWTTEIPGSGPFFVFARTDASHAHSGTRYIGVETNIPGPLEFPPVSNPDHISVWVKGGGSSGAPSGYVGKVLFQSTDSSPFPAWVTVDEASVHIPIGYFEVTFDPLYGANGQDPPLTRHRLLLQPEGNGAIYIDDITITLEAN